MTYPSLKRRKNICYSLNVLISIRPWYINLFQLTIVLMVDYAAITCRNHGTVLVLQDPQNVIDEERRHESISSG